MEAGASVAALLKARLPAAVQFAAMECATSLYSTNAARRLLVFGSEHLQPTLCGSVQPQYRLSNST